MALFIGLGSRAGGSRCLQPVSGLADDTPATVPPSSPCRLGGEATSLGILDSWFPDAAWLEDREGWSQPPPPLYPYFLTRPGFGFILIYPLNSNLTQLWVCY